jgi:hypothetical protein
VFKGHAILKVTTYLPSCFSTGVSGLRLTDADVVASGSRITEFLVDFGNIVCARPHSLTKKEIDVHEVYNAEVDILTFE